MVLLSVHCALIEPRHVLVQPVVFVPVATLVGTGAAVEVEVGVADVGVAVDVEGGTVPVVTV